MSRFVNLINCDGMNCEIHHSGAVDQGPGQLGPADETHNDNWCDGYGYGDGGGGGGGNDGGFDNVEVGVGGVVVLVASEVMMIMVNGDDLGNGSVDGDCGGGGSDDEGNR